MSGPVIGVTGLPCAGKSCAAGLLAEGRVAGVPAGLLLKADDIGHAVLLLPEVLAALRKRFGVEVVPEDGDPVATRRNIAARVFADQADLLWLERLIHPLVNARIDQAVAAAGPGESVVVEAALLFASGTDARCGCILVVEADFAVRLRRARERGWDREELERRQERQIPLFEEAWRGPDRDKLVRVANEQDDGMLAERIAAALAARAACDERDGRRDADRLRDKPHSQASGPRSDGSIFSKNTIQARQERIVDEQ